MSLGPRRLILFVVAGALCTGLLLPAAGAVPPKKRKRAPVSIKACSHAKTGQLRLRGKRRCRKGERGIVWSVRGPRGAKGARGLRGPAGSGGTDGTNGSALSAIFSARATAYSSVLNPGYAAVSGITEVSATEATVETLAPASGFTAGGLAVNATSAPGAGGSITVSLRANGADSPLTCTISDPATTCLNRSSAAAIPGGSTISLQITSSGTILTTNLLVGFEGR